ncbi:MAG: RidA family protein [Rhodospirillaceae bacterium]
MARKLISSGSDFEKVAGYSRAVVVGDRVFVSGTTGFDYAAGTISDDVVAQTEQAFLNIQAALSQAGASLDDAVRVRAYLADASDFMKVAPVFGRFLGVSRPANTTIGVQMVDPRIKIEIEITTCKGAE